MRYNDVPVEALEHEDSPFSENAPRRRPARWVRRGAVAIAASMPVLLLLARLRARPAPGVGGRPSAAIAAAAQAGPSPPEYDTAWQRVVSGSGCGDTQLSSKSGGHATLACAQEGGRRHFTFPAGKFDIDQQVVIPAHTVIEGSANPNSAADKTQKPDPATQTYFVATHGVSGGKAAYCGTNSNLKQGDAQRLRIGFLLNSHTAVRSINFQGRDTTRPDDNGNLCGGAVFETPGCVSPGFGDGKGGAWVSKRTGCYDHVGHPNNLILGDGKGVDDVVIENVRLNDLFLPEHATKEQLIAGQASQVGVWTPMTADGRAVTNLRITNLVSMLTRGDGINLHGNVENAIVEDSTT